MNHPPYSKELQNHLAGRLLLAAEIPFPPELLTEQITQGHVSEICGVIRENERFTCLRCGNQNRSLFYTFPCKICNQDCAYCRACIVMGRVSECTKLYGWTGPPISFSIPDKVMGWEGTLSAGQQTASDCVVKAIKEKGEFLVWAV